ncbi:MAG TPA: universal stress protein [Candidatus Latescibacteria bacterium]|nr:universal stress protein [Candidatus Latescibacterota bacterium]
MFSRVIVATDLSPASYAVVNCVGGLKAYGAKECLLLQCLSLQEVGSVALSYTTAFLENSLNEQKEVLEKQGFAVETRIVPRLATREINRVAEKEDYSLIVIGSQGHSMVREALLGGVASAVLNQARKPVLVIRVEPVPGDANGCLRAARCDFSGHILYPTDFSENADLAFTYVEKLAAEGARHVTLLHVQDKTRIESYLKHRLEEFNEIDRGRLGKMRETLEKKGNAEVDVELKYGIPFVEISQFIKEHDVNLVVMGTQGRGFVAELFLGSVSHNIARHSEAAVLLIPNKS